MIITHLPDLVVSYQGDTVPGQYVAFGDLPVDHPKRLSGATELTGKGVRRINLRADVPFYKATGSSQIEPIKAVLSAALTVNIPSEEGLQLCEPTTLFENKSMAAALATALNNLIASIMPTTPFAITAGALMDTDHVLCRGSNGVAPYDAEATYGSLT